MSTASLPNVNPRSLDATLARIEQILLQQNVVAAETKAQVEKTNGRVTALEKWRWIVFGAVSMLVTLLGWAIAIYFK